MKIYDPLLKHVMVDLETLSTRADAVITQIALVEFDVDIMPIRTLDLTVRVDDHQKDRHVSHDALVFWSHQDPAAFQRTLRGVYDLPSALREVMSFFGDPKGDKSWPTDLDNTMVWAHGASFDVPILQLAFETNNKFVPWSFRNVRDTRTLFHIHGRPDIEFEGLEHDAMADAMHQARQVQRIIQDIRREEE